MPLDDPNAAAPPAPEDPEELTPEQAKKLAADLLLAAEAKKRRQERNEVLKAHGYASFEEFKARRDDPPAPGEEDAAAEALLAEVEERVSATERDGLLWRVVAQTRALDPLRAFECLLDISGRKDDGSFCFRVGDRDIDPTLENARGLLPLELLPPSSTGGAGSHMPKPMKGQGDLVARGAESQAFFEKNRDVIRQRLRDGEYR